MKSTFKGQFADPTELTPYPEAFGCLLRTRQIRKFLKSLGTQNAIASSAGEQALWSKLDSSPLEVLVRESWTGEYLDHPDLSSAIGWKVNFFFQQPFAF